MHALQSFRLCSDIELIRKSQPSQPFRILRCMLSVKHGLVDCSNHRARDHHVSFEGVGRQLQSGSPPSSGREQLGQMEDGHAGKFTICCSSCTSVSLPLLFCKVRQHVCKAVGNHLVIEHVLAVLFDRCVAPSCMHGIKLTDYLCGLQMTAISLLLATAGSISNQALEVAAAVAAPLLCVATLLTLWSLADYMRGVWPYM